MSRRRCHGAFRHGHALGPGVVRVYENLYERTAEARSGFVARDRISGRMTMALIANAVGSTLSTVLDALRSEPGYGTEDDSGRQPGVSRLAAARAEGSAAPEGRR